MAELSGNVQDLDARNIQHAAETADAVVDTAEHLSQENCQTFLQPTEDEASSSPQSLSGAPQHCFVKICMMQPISFRIPTVKIGAFLTAVSYPKDAVLSQFYCTFMQGP